MSHAELIGERAQVNNGVHDIRLDAANLNVTFAVRWLGVLTVRGRFMDVEGTLRVPDGCIEHAEINVQVKAASLRTGVRLRDRHLRGPQFLDAGRYPTISFRSTRVDRPNGILLVTGQLALRGQERQVRATCPVDYADGAGMSSLVRVCGGMVVTRLPYAIGVAHGIDRLNPLLYAIGTDVSVQADVLVPASDLLPALLPALGP